MTKNSPPGSPKSPKHLGAAGRTLWRQFQADYQISDTGGLLLLTQAAEAMDRMRSAQAIIAKEGEIVTNRLGAPAAHPAVSIELQSRNALLKALSMLHLDIEPLRAIGRPPAGSERR